jgi:hypothetical protein
MRARPVEVARMLANQVPQVALVEQDDVVE